MRLSNGQRISSPPQRKGKPKGDGIRLEPGRAMSLEGSTPSPSAERCARGRAAQASVFQTGQAGSTPAGHSADPRRSATDGSLTRRRTTWPGRQPADHPSSELGMLGVQLPPGPLKCPGGPARSGRHPLKVKSVGSNPIQGAIGNFPGSSNGRTAGSEPARVGSSTAPGGVR